MHSYVCNRDRQQAGTPGIFHSQLIGPVECFFLAVSLSLLLSEETNVLYGDMYNLNGAYRIVTTHCHNTLSHHIVTPHCHTTLSHHIVTQHCHITWSHHMVTRHGQTIWSHTIVTPHGRGLKFTNINLYKFL